jgi:hypothetical protein
MGCCDKNYKINNEVNCDLKGLICFCFKHSKQSLFDSIQSNTEEDIINDIKKKMKDSGCFCEISNPSGKCCMADVMGFIKQHKEIS